MGTVSFMLVYHCTETRYVQVLHDYCKLIIVLRCMERGGGLLCLLVRSVVMVIHTITFAPSL